MYLQSVVLSHFRSYSQKKFDFDPKFTVIVGVNTAGKTNLVEGICLLTTGKSFRAEKDFQMIQQGQDVAHVQGLLQGESVKGKEESSFSPLKLEVILAQGQAVAGRFTKKYLVNEIPKSRSNFAGFLPAVFFRPEELDIITDGPSLRRSFLDEILEPLDKEYAASKLLYEKALRQRNALLDVVRETGRRNEEQFSYWDNLLITNGTVITQKREMVIDYINRAKKDVFAFTAHYDKSIMSKERLLQYKDAEVASGVTLVGPQRDDFFVTMGDGKEMQNVQHFGSRGQQRLVILQLKLLHIAFAEEALAQKPLLVLDDIFSELDSGHIQLVLEKIQKNQVILTTTHKEFLSSRKIKDFAMIELSK